jgi:FkbH-like protein
MPLGYNFVAVQTMEVMPSSHAIGASASALVRAEWQPWLFGAVSRAALLPLVAEWPCRRIDVRVHRNHGFEAVASATHAYAGWNLLEFEYAIGAYDDTLSFARRAGGDVELIWLDVTRLEKLSGAELGTWLTSRLRALRNQTSNPIVVLAWPLDSALRAALEQAPLAGVHIADLDALAAEIGETWIDQRTLALSGTRLSNAACLRIARELACCWIPACVQTPIKAIAVDLDQTLYRGILGEDGPSGVELTAAHGAFQSRLAALGRNGTFLALVSRNEPADVQALFAQREDFPLRLDDFSAVEVSWGDKSEAIQRIADRLRIGTNSIIFVDDNAGELAAVAARLPVVTVHARPDAAETEAALVHVAGLWRWKGSAEDGIRAVDLRAATIRDELAHATTIPSDYLKSLHIRLEYLLNPRDQLARVFELGQKTNQFTLALRRFKEAELAARMEGPDSGVVAIRLSDRLSDSGIVGVIVGTREADTLHVEELCVSCRALGRHLEDSMLTQGLLLLTEGREPRALSFALKKGPRNQPGRQWLSNFLALELDEGASEVTVPVSLIRDKAVAKEIDIEIIR